ncbi:hypothetical protein KXD40_002539 [Peronospora effusa]|uniref:Helicase-associated domain-containing protein n=1 Tax=Peronospora effusa TaxID=542832 RepID=A0A3M6VPD4_9STRA|nr:hypothetical protein DD238_004288 [Peronospora effusa]UIZ27157.1 hypothetical protein KXD40_002539 [Peronospora effusa]CAI5703898.1 unnamed protein product [Peronospora effusa]
MGHHEWPEIFWNLRLGQIVMSIKYADTYKPQRDACMDELHKIHFSTQYWKERMWDSKIFPALETFRREFGHCNVQYKFVVPDSENWPQQTRGVRLGAIVANMRCRGDYDVMVNRDKDKLKAIGFVWSPDDERWSNRILPAFETYSKVYKSGWVPLEFTVPESEPWPEQTRGLKLGSIFMKIRQTGSYSSYVERDRDRLDAIGVNFKAPYKK